MQIFNSKSIDMTVLKGDNGPSAYEVYQKNGGTLSLEQWFVSLKASRPVFVFDVADMTDTTLTYLISDDEDKGHLYQYSNSNRAFKDTGIVYPAE